MAISQKKLEANRQNAKKSTGPKTRRGKNAIRLNALIHGLYARDLILDSPNCKEDKKDYKLLLSTLAEELKPVGLLEESLVYKMTNSLWRSRRALRAETAHINDSINKEENGIDPKEIWRQIEIARNPALAPPKTTEELTELVTLFQKTRKFVEHNGYVSENLLNQLFDLYPADEPGIDTLYSMNDEQIDHCNPIPEEISRLIVTNDEKTQRKNHMLKLIDDDITRIEIRIRRANLSSPSSKKSSHEKEKELTIDNEIGLNAIPERHISRNILWYEMRLDRQFNRALNQLLKLQERRKRWNSKND